MGATVYKHMIYIDPKLSRKLSEREKAVLIAHEIGHDRGHDRIQIVMFMLALTTLTFVAFMNGMTLIGVVLMVIFYPAVRAHQRHLEYMADQYALNRTKDFEAFITLMDKLEHNGDTHPGKAERIDLAKQMRQEYERR